MADNLQSLFRIDPTQGLVEYVNTVKPYHTKVLDVLMEYVYSEQVNVTIGEKWNTYYSFTRPDGEVVSLCGYGFKWDVSGIKSPEAVPVSLIVNATGKLFIDVTVASSSSAVTIIRNVTGHVLTPGNLVTFDTDTTLPTTTTGSIQPFVPYHVVSVVGNAIQLSETSNGTPITFTSTDTLRLAPVGLPYNTFLVTPTLTAASYDCLVTNLNANQLSFVDGYNITSVDTATNTWRFSVGTITPGSGYTPGTFSGISLAGGTGTGAVATIVVGNTGQVSEVRITNTGTTAYTIGDVLTAPSLPTGTGFSITVVVPSLTIPLTTGNLIYINGNSSATANGTYTISSVQGSEVHVTEHIPPLTTASGTLYVTDQFDTIPYWQTGTKVIVEAISTLPLPLAANTPYYFIPTQTLGIFNLATKRYPQVATDYIDISSISGKFLIRRAEPFSPGDYVDVSNSYMHKNDGTYIISTVEPEGNNYRVSVLQSVASTTPTPAPANDGAMTLASGSYDMPQFCFPVKTPDLYAGTYVHENLQFTFTITGNDRVGTTTIENDYGWGTDMFGTSASLYGSSTPFNPYTAITGSQLLIPTGFDTQLFDVGFIDEDLSVVQ